MPTTSSTRKRPPEEIASAARDVRPRASEGATANAPLPKEKLIAIRRYAPAAVAVTFAEGTALPQDGETHRREIDAAEKELAEASNDEESSAVMLLMEISRKMEEARQMVERAQKKKADAQEKLTRLRGARSGSSMSVGTVGTFSVGESAYGSDDELDGKPRAKDVSKTNDGDEDSSPGNEAKEDHDSSEDDEESSEGSTLKGPTKKDNNEAKEDQDSSEDKDLLSVGGRLVSLSLPLIPHGHSDEEEDVDEMLVSGCGTEAINGTYWRSNFGPILYPEYCMKGRWEGRSVEFTIHYELQQRRWAISIVKGNEPIRFYNAPAKESSKLPPREGWKGPAYKGRGMNPAPLVTPASRAQSSENARFHKQMRRMNSNEGDESGDDNNVGDTPEPREMVVEGCGVPACNGTYYSFGDFDGVAKYQKIAQRDGLIDNFLLYRSQIPYSGERRWMISCTPNHTDPGTMNDEFYYTAPSATSTAVIKGKDNEIPPKTGWTTAFAGVEPVPRVYPKTDDGEPRAASGGQNSGRSAQVQRGGHGKLLR